MKLLKYIFNRKASEASHFGAIEFWLFSDQGEPLRTLY